jgi:uracil-DNA glycosylase
MKTASEIQCTDFPCGDIRPANHIIPNIEINPSEIKMLMISETPPVDKNDFFYADKQPFYLQTTLQAFQDAGVNVRSIHDILSLGIYITTAIKCAKKDLAVSLLTIQNCSALLEKEIELFPNVKAIILNGDVAIKAFNYIAKKQTKQKVIPAGSTYKIRKNQFYYKDVRVFPSYILTGKNFLIEKSKRRMISEDIREAMESIQ